MPPIDHDFVQVAADGAGKQVGNVKQTDPDAEEVYLQKTVTWDPEDATDSGGLRVTDGRAHIQQRAEVAEATGTLGAADDAATLDLTGYPGAVFTLVGDLDGTVRFEGRISAAADWGTVLVYSAFHGDYISSSSGGSETWDQGAFIDVAGYESVRLRCHAYTSGSSAVVLRTVAAPPIQRITAFETIRTSNSDSSQVDGHSATIGAKADGAYTSGDGTLVALLKGIFGRLPQTSGQLDTRATAIDGGIATLGSVSDPETAGSGSLIAIAKRLRTLLAGGLPASLGQKTMANSLAVTVASDQSAVPVSGTFWQATQPVSGTVTANVPGHTTATLSNVNDSASNVTLLASNANRKGATIHNDSTAVLYVKLGATASTTSFTVKMSAGAYYEVPFGYTGIIDGIWASDASGAARVTEITA